MIVILIWVSVCVALYASASCLTIPPFSPCGRDQNVIVIGPAAFAFDVRARNGVSASTTATVFTTSFLLFICRNNLSVVLSITFTSSLRFRHPHAHSPEATISPQEVRDRYCASCLNIHFLPMNKVSRGLWVGRLQVPTTNC